VAQGIGEEIAEHVPSTGGERLVGGIQEADEAELRRHSLKQHLESLRVRGRIERA
jgi:hypothetical protein